MDYFDDIWSQGSAEFYKGWTCACPCVHIRVQSLFYSKRWECELPVYYCLLQVYRLLEGSDCACFIPHPACNIVSGTSLTAEWILIAKLAPIYGAHTMCLVLVTVLYVNYLLILTTTLLYLPHFTNGETEAQGGEGALLKVIVTVISVFTEHLVCVRHCSKGFIHTGSFNAPTSLWSQYHSSPHVRSKEIKAPGAMRAQSHTPGK